jgi:hypothetical protein
MSLAQRFNATGFSRWVNGPRGRAFRLVAGAAWLVVGLVFLDRWWGVAAAAWSVLPLSAGMFDVCWISAALGGPLSSRTIRAAQAVRI